MLRFLAAMAILMLSGFAAADDVNLSADEITELLSGRSLYAGPSDEVEQIFQSGGLTVFIEQGHASNGLWKVENGKYCSQWPPSQVWSCYDVVRDGAAITFVSRSGNRYPMRECKR